MNMNYAARNQVLKTKGDPCDNEHEGIWANPYCPILSYPYFFIIKFEE